MLSLHYFENFHNGLSNHLRWAARSILPKVALQLGKCKYFSQVIPPRENKMVLAPTLLFVASYDMFGIYLPNFKNRQGEN